MEEEDVHTCHGGGGCLATRTGRCSHALDGTPLPEPWLRLNWGNMLGQTGAIKEMADS